MSATFTSLLRWLSDLTKIKDAQGVSSQHISFKWISTLWMIYRPFGHAWRLWRWFSDKHLCIDGFPSSWKSTDKVLWDKDGSSLLFPVVKWNFPPTLCGSLVQTQKHVFNKPSFYCKSVTGQALGTHLVLSGSLLSGMDQKLNKTIHAEFEGGSVRNLDGSQIKLAAISTTDTVMHCSRSINRYNHLDNPLATPIKSLR